MPPFSPLTLKVGELLAEASKIALDERKRLTPQLKSDGSIVTNADIAVDKFLKFQCVENLLPGSGFWGEELGQDFDGKSDIWLSDPIDGTSNFRFGLPYWGISLGLMQNGKLVLGGIALPDLNEIYLAEDGKGAAVNGDLLPQMKQDDIQHFELVSVSESLLKAERNVEWPGKLRLSGAFVIDGAFVAAGRFRGLIGRRESLYDVAASIVLCREVGAHVSYADGEAWSEANYLTEEKLVRPWMIMPTGNTWRLKKA